MPHVISEATVDDLLREAVSLVMATGERIVPSKGPCLEVSAVSLELRRPLARASRTETRGTIFSCVGELLWYLAGSNDVEHIAYYVPRYRESAENGLVYGGYGPRLFNQRGHNQIQQVIDMLRTKPDSRQAVVQLFEAQDLVEPHRDVPCTCSLQFLLRSNGLRLVVYMRSNDLFLGTPHDIFAFTMIQEIVARSLQVELGTYVHMVGSLHIYETNMEDLDRFLAEGWQTTELEMPPMPCGDPWPSVQELVRFEESLRMGADPLEAVIPADPYWGDIARLLVVYSLSKLGRWDDVQTVATQFVHGFYRVFVDDRLDRDTGRDQ